MLIINLEPDGYSRRAATMLSQIGIYEETKNPTTAQKLECEILILRIGIVINETVLEQYPKLRAIATNVTGLDHIDVVACERREIKVISLRSNRESLEKVSASAEFTVALMLSITRRIPEAFIYARSEENVSWDRYAFGGLLLAELKVGIVGFGRNGQLIGNLLSGLGVAFSWNDAKTKTKTNWPNEQKPLFELLRESNVVMLCIDYSPENIGFFDDEKLSAMQMGSFFINTSRGQLVCERALIEALESNRLAAAATDVIENEREPQNSPLVEYAQTDARLLVTPHIAGCAAAAWRYTEEIVANEIAKEMTQL